MRRGKKKSLFDRAIDALTNRDEREAEEAAQAKAARQGAERRGRPAAEKALPDEREEGNAAIARTAMNRVQAPEEEIRTVRVTGPEKGIVTVRSLRIRADHSTTSEVVGGLLKGEQITILSTWTDGRDTWAQLDGGWAAMVYNGETYIDPV